MALYRFLLASFFIDRGSSSPFLSIVLIRSSINSRLSTEDAFSLCLVTLFLALYRLYKVNYRYIFHRKLDKQSLFISRVVDRLQIRTHNC